MADNVGLSPAQPCNGFWEAPDRFENRVPSWGRNAGNWIGPWGWEVLLIILISHGPELIVSMKTDIRSRHE